MLQLHGVVDLGVSKIDGMVDLGISRRGVIQGDLVDDLGFPELRGMGFGEHSGFQNLGLLGFRDSTEIEWTI